MEVPMSDGIDTKEALRDALSVVTKVLVAQAIALDEMFYRSAKEAFSTEDISYYHARTALKAQARCRATFKVLLALRKGAAARKIPNFTEETIQELKTPVLPNSYPERAVRARRLPLPTPGRCRKGWTPERRARQALAIRNWQPWRKSTGPRTEAGKARSARNALKHGLRSKAVIEARREDRRSLADAARNLSIAKSVFATISDKCERPIPGSFHSIDIGSPTHALIPSRPRITRESPPGGSPPPVTTASPRRGWRIAS
jgi:hypothetical protein